MASVADPHAADASAAPDPALAELHRVARLSQAKMGKENFPVALRVLPRDVRAELAHAYAFARFVDDTGDAAHGDRSALLELIDADLGRLGAGTPELSPVCGMLALVRERGLPVQTLRDLVEANRRDQTVTHYETFDDLLGYCALSAAPIGRIVLTLAGVTAAEAVERSDRVCSALQVLEHCQDVREDAVAGRVYLPASELRAAGVTDAELRTSSTPAAVRRVVARQVERAEVLLEAGRPLVRQLHGWARFAVAGYVAGGRATALALRRAEFDVLGRAVRPTKLATARYALALGARR